MNQLALSSPENLIRAALNGSLKGVKAALEAGADINATGEYNETALFTACQHHHPRIARFLLSCPGIDIMKGRLSHWPQGVAGCVRPSEGLHNTTPLYATINTNQLSLARAILNHPDKDKYLQSEENWTSTVKGTFNHIFNPAALGVLLDAAAPYPQLHQLTIDCAVEYSFSFHEAAPRLAEFLRERGKNELSMTQQALARHIPQLVEWDDDFSLKYTLAHASNFCDVKELLPVLQAALQIAAQKKHTGCRRVLSKMIATLGD